MKRYELSPVGSITALKNIRCLAVRENYKPALLHLDKFSHAIVFYIGNDNKKSKSSHSLSPIRTSVAAILSVDQDLGLVKIKNDVIPHGAAVVDIKPYFPVEDRVRDCVVPAELSGCPQFVEEGNIPEACGDEDPGEVIAEGKDHEQTVINPCGVIRKTEGRCFIEFGDADEALFGYYAGFSHIRIIWWFSRFEKDNFRKTTTCRPPYEKAPVTGIFASRSPVRPNPIGLTTARILKINSNRKTIEITPIDAFDKTPVMDVKPYIPAVDRVKEFNVPQWVDHWSDWYIEEEPEKHSGFTALAGSDFNKLSGLSGRIEEPDAAPAPAPTAARRESADGSHIVVTGARENNLKNISLRIPKNRMTVISGLSGSGKSSIAFDTIYAESQRRFMDSISSTGRQFFKQFEKPKVDQISNLPPAIAVEQKSISRNIRSTVGTVSDINDYLRLLYARIGVRHCPRCGRAVEAKTVHEIMKLLSDLCGYTSFNIVSLKSGKPRYPHEPSGAPLTEEEAGILKRTVKDLLEEENGAFKVVIPGDESFILHTRNHCYYCGLSFFELTPSFFSSNNPESMCPVCDGLGTKMNVSPDLIVSRPERSVLDEASAWWGDLRKYIRNPTGNWMKGEIIALAQSMEIDLELPWNQLPKEFRQKALFGTDGEIVSLRYKGSNGRSGDISRPVEGAVNHIKRLFRGSHNKSSGEFYMQFMEEEPCPACHGEQLCAESRFVTVADRRFPETAAMSIDSLKAWLRELPKQLSSEQLLISGEIIDSLLNKANALIDVGLHYLTLRRTLPTLSGGEAQRLRLSTQLGCGLTNLLYILDEPSAGLHASDQRRLIDTMKRLRDNGNTLIVVEHDAATMLEADHLIEIGPGAGIGGGHVTAEGSPKEVMADSASVTGSYLSGELVTGPAPGKTRRKPYGFLTIRGARKNNLKKVDASFPLGMFICVTGRSGSGKSSLVTKTLSPILGYYYDHDVLLKGDYDSIEGAEQIDSIVTITQEAIGRTPRSNPATYTGVFDEIRKIFASTPEARKRKYPANRFSFNSKDGRCGACSGEGRKRIEMNFMPDIWITCPECRGRRFNSETLQVTYKDRNIADILEMDIEEAGDLFAENEKAAQILNTLRDVGLGYLKIGQSATTLSGGEAQRVKLSKELSKQKKGKTLYILDEPTAGLHFVDIDHLLTLIHRIVDEGNTVIVIEHNADMKRNADWIIELGPEGGDRGGYIISEGAPERG